MLFSRPWMESLPLECRSRPTRPGRAEGQTSASRSGSPARTPGAVNTTRYSQSCQPPFVSRRQELRASFPFRARRASNQTRTAQLCNSCPSKAARRSIVCVLRACGFEPDTPAALMSPALVSQSANLSSPAVTLEEAAHRRRTPTSQRRQRKAQNRSRSFTGPLVWRLGTSPQHHWNHKSHTQERALVLLPFVRWESCCGCSCGGNQFQSADLFRPNASFHLQMRSYSCWVCRHPQKEQIRFNEKLFKFAEAGFVGRLCQSCFLSSFLLRTF